MLMRSASNQLSGWVEEFTRELLSWALHKVSDTETAKDLVQDTFLAAAEKINDFRGESSPKTWLFSILNYKIIDHYRKKVKQPVSLDDDSFLSFFSAEGDWKKEKKPRDWHEEESHLLDNPEFMEVLSKCLKELPEKWNASVRLKYLLNKTGEEICQELDMTPTNLWQIIHRAKVKLRDCVESKWFEN